MDHFSSGHNFHPTEQSPHLYMNARKLSRVEENNSVLSSSKERIGDLRRGLTIRHDRFGTGKIIDLSGEGDNAKATVEFESFGQKQLLLKFAKFTIV